MKSSLAVKINFFLLIFSLPLWAQSNISLTVTNSNLALVRESRTIELKKGMQNFLLTDVPEQIMPTSVLVDSKGRGFHVLEQNYEYDLIGVEKLLEKSLNKTIWVVDPQLGMFSGKLLSNSSDYLMLLDEDGKIQIIPKNDQQKVVLKNFDMNQSGFITRPTLNWKIDALQAGKHSFNMSYLTKGLNWHADYVGKLNKDDTALQLASWVTVENHCGKTFRNANLKLMAGKLNLVEQTPSFSPNRMLPAILAEKQQFKEHKLFEYHMYTLQRPTTLKNNQTKQIQLLPETKVQVEKTYLVKSRGSTDVNVYISFKNSKANHLGIPLPKGIFRIYKEDNHDLEFVGEDQISHTPKDELVKLKVGKAYDLVCKRTMLKRKSIGKSGHQVTVQYVLRNHKEKDVTIIIHETIYNAKTTPKLISSDIKPKRIFNNMIEFYVPVKAGGQTKFQFTYYYQ